MAEVDLDKITKTLIQSLMSNISESGYKIDGIRMLYRAITEAAEKEKKEGQSGGSNESGGQAGPEAEANK